MPLPIVHYNDSVLRRKGEPVKVFDAALAQLAEAMIETMRAAPGIGLAAQQIGRAIQLCVVDVREVKTRFDWSLDGQRPPKELFMPLVLVNPALRFPAGRMSVVEEGCLSFPDIHGDVERPEVVEATYQDVHGIKHVLICDGMLSRCIQHEVDHLNGVLFIDRMDKASRAAIERDVKELAKRTRDTASPA